MIMFLTIWNNLWYERRMFPCQYKWRHTVHIYRTLHWKEELQLPPQLVSPVLLELLASCDAVPRCGPCTSCC